MAERPVRFTQITSVKQTGDDGAWWRHRLACLSAAAAEICNWEAKGLVGDVVVVRLVDITERGSTRELRTRIEIDLGNP